MHALVRLESDRRQWFGTYFLRNRPQLEMICRLAEQRQRAGKVSIAVLGCSLGAEVYSIAWSVRSAMPELEVAIRGVDISAEAIEIARDGVYGLGVSEFASEPLYERMTDAEMRAMFVAEGGRQKVKPWVKEGITWSVGDARDPAIASVLGRHDIVVANDFLCHMRPIEAEGCLRNIARLVQPDGFLVVAGIDLDVRTRVARDLGWSPVRDLLEEIHEGDRALRVSWPWSYWSLEPFDRARHDRDVRYAAVFRVGMKETT